MAMERPSRKCDKLARSPFMINQKCALRLLKIHNTYREMSSITVPHAM